MTSRSAPLRSYSVNTALLYKMNRVYSHDVTAAMFVSQNKEMAAILVSLGTHDPEPTSPLCCCYGVFTDRFVFRLNFPRMRLPQEADDQLQETNLTS